MPPEELPEIAGMLREMGLRRQVTVNVNNYYEGSAPLKLRRIAEQVGV